MAVSFPLRRMAVVAQRGRNTRGFHSQHRTPVLPQLHTSDKLPETPRIQVGYLLHRHPVVKPTLHPLERTFGFLLERQHEVYSRHPSSESAVHFFRDQQQSIDSHQRTDPQDIRRDFFGLEGYREALQASLPRLQHHIPRVRPADYVANAPHTVPTSESCPDTPPQRHTLQRKLDDYLYLVVQYKDAAGMEGKWGVPFTPLRESETLRMAAERALQEPHRDAVEFYLWGCGPQGTLLLPSEERLFLYTSTYLAGRPNFSAMQPQIQDHAWVSRRELCQYRDAFASSALLELLMDVTADAYFETP